MSRHGVSSTRVRPRLVRLAVAAAVVLALTSLARAEWRFQHRVHDPVADAGIVLAPKVASTTKGSAVLLSVTAPGGQPPGVIYAVTRMTRAGLATVCTGPAPLHCADRLRDSDGTVSYSVSSSLDGRGTATTTIDVVATPRPTPDDTQSPTRRADPVAVLVRGPTRDRSPAGDHAGSADHVTTSPSTPLSTSTSTPTVPPTVPPAVPATATTSGSATETIGTASSTGPSATTAAPATSETPATSGTSSSGTANEPAVHGHDSGTSDAVSTSVAAP